MTRARTTPLSVIESSSDARLRSWVELLRLSQQMTQRITAVIEQRGGPTLPQFDILATLRHGDGITQQELAERLLVTKGNVCQVLDRLEKLKWVQRRGDAKDGRVKRV